LTFTEGRIDRLTGVGNGKALEEQLEVLLSAMERGGALFTVALVSIDVCDPLEPEETHDGGRQLLQDIATTIQITMRDSDFVARYGTDEFVVVMPHTSLAGGSVFAERLRQRVKKELPATVSCGIAEAAAKDTIKMLLSRADSALYSAKAAGTNRQFLHTGTQIREHFGRRTEGTAADSAASETSGAAS
jgi:diguanylate cyclase (GGDEF)-like protein